MNYFYLDFEQLVNFSPFQSSLVHLSCVSEADLFFSLLPPPPSPVQLLQDAQASEGQVVVLECRVRGSPPLQVRWYRHGEEILDSPDFRVLQKSETFVVVNMQIQLFCSFFI